MFGFLLFAITCDWTWGRIFVLVGCARLGMVHCFGTLGCFCFGLIFVRFFEALHQLNDKLILFGLAHLEILQA